MINIIITSGSATFYSSVSNGEITSELYEPKWTKNDDNSFSLNTSEGIFCITIADFTLNNNQYYSVDDAIVYLDTL
jgi:hypothetical protein